MRTRLAIPTAIMATVLSFAIGGTSQAKAASSAARTTASCPGVIIPMYGDVPKMWQHLTASPPRATTAIANLGNGPGPSRDPKMAAMFAKARAAGIRVIGYVYTTYGKRPLGDVKRDIDRWESWYPVDGIFVDNLTSAGPNNLSYFRAVSTRIRTWPDKFIVMNGWATRDYMPLTDVMLMMEGPFSTFKTFQTPEWTRSYAASRFANIVYGVPDAQGMRAVFKEAARRNLGMLYVTDQPWPEPYFGFPSFLRSQDGYLDRRSGCGTAAAATSASGPGQPAMMSAWRPAASAVR